MNEDTYNQIDQEEANASEGLTTKRKDRQRKITRVVIIVLGIILTPVAMFICGFCCCLMGLVGQNEYFAVIGFFAGIIVGAVLSIMAMRSLLKRLR